MTRPRSRPSRTPLPASPATAPQLHPGGDPSPDHLPLAAWPVVACERARVAALRASGYRTLRDNHADATQYGAVFPGAPLWALFARDIPLAVDPTPGASPPPDLDTRPYVALPAIVAPFLGAVYATTPEAPPGESGAVPRRPPAAPVVWAQAPLPVWFLAVLRAVERIPVAMGNGVTAPDRLTLAAWPSSAACALSGVLCRITAEEWATLDTIRGMAPLSTSGEATHVPWPVFAATLGYARAVAARHLPAWLAAQPVVGEPLEAVRGRDSHADVVRYLRGIFDPRYPEYAGDGVLPQGDRIARNRADRVIAPTGVDTATFLTTRGWSYPSHTIRQVPPGPYAGSWDRPDTGANIGPAHIDTIRAFDAAGFTEADAQDAWWCMVVWWRASRALQLMRRDRERRELLVSATAPEGTITVKATATSCDTFAPVRVRRTP